MHGTVPASLSELHHERLIAWQIQSAQQCANVAVTVMLVMPRKAKMYALMPCTSSDCICTCDDACEASPGG